MWVKQTAKRQLTATQNAQQLTILIQKFKTFSEEVPRSPGEGYSTLANPIPSGEGVPLPIPHPPRRLRRIDFRALGARSLAPKVKSCLWLRL